MITTLGPTATNPNNFYHAQNRYIDGDNAGVNPVGSGVLSVTGEVYNDVNVDGKLDSSDPGLANVTVTLTGTDLLWQLHLGDDHDQRLGHLHLQWVALQQLHGLRRQRVAPIGLFCRRGHGWHGQRRGRRHRHDQPRGCPGHRTR